MKINTPRTDALILELSMEKSTTFLELVKKTKRHVEFTRELEREIVIMKNGVEKTEEHF